MISRPLCAAIEIYPDESLMSAVARSADLNLVPNTSMLLKHAGMGSKRAAYLPFTAEAATGQIGTLLGVPEAEVTRRMFRSHDNAAVPTVDWFGTPLVRRFLEAGKRRFSPAGYREAAYGRSYWMVRPLLYCPTTFERLLSQCPSCDGVLGWSRALGVAVCEHCEKSLGGSVDLVPSDLRMDYRELARLIDVNADARAASLDLLPSPFRQWEPGHVFSAVVELGALAECADTVDPPSLWDKLARGDFSPLGDRGIVAGWRMIRSWPDPLDDLVFNTLETRRPFHERRTVLGAFYRYCSPNAKSVLAEEVRERIARAVELLRLPFKQTGDSSNLKLKRGGAITMWDAVREYGVGAELLRHLARDGDCLIERGPGETGLYLFDKVRLSEAVERHRSAVALFDFVKSLGVPAYTIEALIERGLVKKIAEQTTIATSARTLLDPAAVQSLYEALRNLPPAGGETKAMVRLSARLRTALSPFAWSEVLHGIVSGTLRAHLSEKGISWASRILVSAPGVDEILKRVASLTLPSIGIPAHTAASIVGVNDVVLGKAAQAGLVKRNAGGLDLPSIADFRANHVFPKDITSSLNMSGKMFANTMISAGFKPVATLHKMNVWLRADVIKVFGESTITELSAV